MSGNQNENGETSQASPTKAARPQEKIPPATAVEPITREEVKADKKGLTYDTTTDAWEICPETGQPSSESPVDESPSRALWARSRYRIFLHVLVWLVMTGSVTFQTKIARFRFLIISCRWWIAGLVLHRYDLGWLIPFLLWLGLTIRLVTLHISTAPITRAASFVWLHAVSKPVDIIPEKFRLPLGAAGTIAVIVVGTFASPDSADNTRTNRTVSLFGLLVFVGAFYATSRDRKKINWHTVVVGILAQFLLALFVLRTKAGVSPQEQQQPSLSLMYNVSTISSTSLPI
jgi:CNT family concentrative nucleoside transporter